MNSSPTQLKSSTERYETLRRHFMEHRRLLADDPLELTLLLREGIAAWIYTLQSSTESAPKALAPSTESKPSTPTSSVWQQELTRLIAHMTAPHLHFHTA